MRWMVGSQETIRTNYDPEADVLQIRFGGDGAKYDRSTEMAPGVFTEMAPGVFVEFDAAGQPIGVEIISVRKRSGAAFALQPAA